MRSAMGLIAGPDKPPVMLVSLGRRVSTSIDMPRKVFVKLNASAPASAASFAMVAIDVTLGDSFTINGTVDAALACLTRYSSETASEPNTMPPACTLGHETLSSYAEMPG